MDRLNCIIPVSPLISPKCDDPEPTLRPSDCLVEVPTVCFAADESFGYQDSGVEVFLKVTDSRVDCPVKHGYH